MFCKNQNAEQQEKNNKNKLTSSQNGSLSHFFISKQYKDTIFQTKNVQ